MMNNSLWARMHGGVTHFPIAMLIASMLFDLIGYGLNREPVSRDLHAASFYALMLGALASFAAVLSGLLLSRFEVFGSGSLGKHHTFLWPAFALLIGLAVWRLIVRDRASRRAFACYLAVSIVATVLMSGAGYWGGELMMGM